MSCNYLVQDGCNRSAPGGDVLSPYVRIKFQVKTNQETGTTRDLTEITVGNESSPGIENSACIKSFEFGNGNGAILKATIHDDMGGSFTKFMENILKDIKCAIPTSGVTLVVDFGWIRSSCDGSFIFEKSPDYYVICMSINCNFSDGKFMFEVSGTDTIRHSEDTRYIASFGQDGDGEYITDVLNKTFKDPKTKPTINTDVKFLRIGKGKVCNSLGIGSCNPLNVEECKFKDKDGQAPKVKVSANNLDKINFAKELIAKYPTDKDKGWIPAYNSMCPGGQVIFWEDPMPDCNEAFSWERTMLGKFIVNGGNDTRVIQFNPSIKWQFASLTNAGGSAGDAQVMANQNGGKNEGKGKDCPSLSREQIGNAGSQTTSEADENQVAKHGTDANKKVDEANAADRRANGFLLNHEPVEADLVIVGDPQLIRPDLCPWRNIWIVFFNPFFIRNTGVVGRNADWLSVPPPGCNPILSNKNWRIQQVTHHIENGKFTTNLRVYLQGGAKLDPNTPLGGIGAGDWIPPTNC
jgi:hypothetical protein